MSEATWVRLTAIAGVVFAVLVIVASQLQGSAPGLDDPAGVTFAYIRDHQRELKASAALFALAMSAVLVWSWGLFGALRKAEKGNVGLAVVSVAGGALAAAMTVASAALIAATALRIDELGPSGARFHFALYRFMQAGTNFGLAVLIGAAAAVSLRRRLFAPWFTIASVIVAIGTLLGGAAIAYAGDAIQTFAGVTLVLAVVWIVAVSIRLWRTPQIAILEAESAPIPVDKGRD